MSPAKTAALIDLPFGLRTRVGPGNHVLDGGPDTPWEGAIFRGKGALNCKVSGHSAVISVNRSRCLLGFGLGWAVGIMC